MNLWLIRIMRVKGNGITMKRLMNLSHNGEYVNDQIIDSMIDDVQDYKGEYDDQLYI